MKLALKFYWLNFKGDQALIKVYLIIKTKERESINK
jgi:hypothetical protein